MTVRSPYQGRRQTRKATALLAAFVALVAGTLPSSVVAQTSITTGAISPAADGEAVIAIVSDGPSAKLNRAIAPTTRYLEELADKDYKVKIRSEFVGDYTVSGIRRQIERALASPGVELVYTAGMIATELAAAIPESRRVRPVFGGFPEFSEREDLRVASTGRSAIPNFTFVATPRRVASDLTQLRELTGAKTIHVIVDQGLLDLYDDWERRGAVMEERVGAQLVMHGATDSADTVLRDLPETTEAVYVAVLPRMTDETQKELYEGLTQREIFSLAMLGPHGVTLGATATLTADMLDPFARRTALNLHQLFLGADTSDLQIYLPSQDQLVINSRASRRIGWSADYETFLSAQFTDEESGRGPPLTAEEAMDVAARANADARVAREAAAVATADLRIARGFLLPNLDLNLNHGGTYTSDRTPTAFALRTPQIGHGGNYGAALTQILFDDSVMSAWRSQARLTRASAREAESVELDARASAGIAFFSHVLQSEFYAIEKENLRLSEGNRRLARLRVDIGTAEPSEIFRWEAEVARDRADLIRRGAERTRTLIEMNRILGVPRGTTWSIDKIKLDDNSYYFMDQSMADIMDRGESLPVVADHMQKLAVENSPELAAFDESLEANDIQLGQRKRAYYTPSFSLQAGYDRALEGGDSLETASQNEWTVGVAMTLPLFAGLRRGAEIQRQEALIRQITAQRDSALQLIEQTARVALHQLHADHANMRLSRRAAVAASLNYDSVLDKYSQGAATILHVLDAQSGLLLQRQQSAAALYGYLIDVITLQRAIAWFESEADEAERAEWARGLTSAIGGTAPPTDEGEKQP